MVSGSFAAIGPSAPFCFWGSFNAALWSSVTTTLTTLAAGTTGTVTSATGLAKGQPINSTLVPRGTTIGNLVGTTITFAFPPGHTAAEVTAGADAAASFVGAVWTGTIQLERSFDGGATWVSAGIGGGGNPAVYTGATQSGAPVSIVVSEPEASVAYRWNCTAYTGPATINYRISQTGLQALSIGVPSA